MKIKNIICTMAITLLLLSGCGGGDSSSSGGKPSSFNVSQEDIDINITGLNEEQNISSIVEEKNGEYIIHVNENQKTAFKLNSDKRNITYDISGEDSFLFKKDKYGGKFAFEEFTNYDKKHIYKIIVIADDGYRITRKKATIYVNKNKNKTPLPKVVNSDTPLARGDEKKYFITTWKTDIHATLHPNTITIPTFGDGYNYSVDWGDGTSSRNVIENISHTYKRAGTYKVKILGNFPRIYFTEGTDLYGNVVDENNLKIISIDQWGEIKWTSMGEAFVGCENLAGQATDIPDLSNVKDMYSMFFNAKSFNQNIGTWNVSNVTDMYAMFLGAEAFNQNIGNWNVSNVTDMSSMFKKAKTFNQDIGNWNVSNVTDMSSMFKKAKTFNQDIGNWNVSNVTNMSSMFNNAKAFNQNIGGWRVSNVKNMSYMFSNARTFNQNIGNWNVSNVKNMSYMFSNARAFNQNIGSWMVSNVTDMSGMFYDARAFNQNIGNWIVTNVNNMSFMFSRAITFNQYIGSWDVSSVMDMSNLFGGAQSFNQDISEWKVDNVLLMGGMFYGAQSFNQNIGRWNVSKVTDMNTMFREAESFNQDISNWSVSYVKNMRKMFKNAVNFNQNLEEWNAPSQPADYIIEAFDKTELYALADMFDGATSMTHVPSWYMPFKDNPEPNPVPLPSGNEKDFFITTWQTNFDAVSITIPTVLKLEYNFNVDWGDGTSNKNVIRDITHVYNKKGTYTIKINGLFPRIHFGKDIDVYSNGNIAFEQNNLRIISIDQWGTNKWSSMLGAFAGCLNLKLQATDRPNLDNVVDMDAMFFHATAFNGNIGDWDVSNVKYMQRTFEEAYSFNSDIGGWDVSNVISMHKMFKSATAFNKNIGNWDVSNVQSMNFMFDSATLFNQNIGNWNVSNVKNMYSMFSNASSFNQNIGNWNVSNVLYMDNMFYYARDFNQNLNNWDTSSVISMPKIFDGTLSLRRKPSWYHEEVTSNKISKKQLFNKPWGYIITKEK